MRTDRETVAHSSAPEAPAEVAESGIPALVPGLARERTSLFLSTDAFALPMILPGLISLAFYRRRPSVGQVILGLLATAALSAVLGYFSPAGPLTRNGSIIVAVVGGVALYFAILAYLYYRYQPRHANSPMPTRPAMPP